MFSLQSKKHFSIINQIKYRLFQIFHKNDIEKYVDLIKKAAKALVGTHD